MTTFKYIGPSTSVDETPKDATVAKSDPKLQIRDLETGQTYDDLPEDHPQIKNLIAHKLLIEVEASPKAPMGDSGNGESGDDVDVSDGSPKTPMGDSSSAGSGDGADAPKTKKPRK